MEGNGLLLDFATIFRIHLSRLNNKDNFEKNSDGDPILRQKMVEESLARLLQSLNFHETVSSDLVFDCITKIIAKQVSLSCSRISYRNGWNTEALIFENLKPVEITKKLFQYHLNLLKNV